MIVMIVMMVVMAMGVVPIVNNASRYSVHSAIINGNTIGFFIPYFSRYSAFPGAENAAVDNVSVKG